MGGFFGRHKKNKNQQDMHIGINQNPETFYEDKSSWNASISSSQYSWWEQEKSANNGGKTSNGEIDKVYTNMHGRNGLKQLHMQLENSKKKGFSKGNSGKFMEIRRTMLDVNQAMDMIRLGEGAKADASRIKEMMGLYSTLMRKCEKYLDRRAFTKEGKARQATVSQILEKCQQDVRCLSRVPDYLSSMSDQQKSGLKLDDVLNDMQTMKIIGEVQQQPQVPPQEAPAQEAAPEEESFQFPTSLRGGGDEESFQFPTSLRSGGQAQEQTSQFDYYGQDSMYEPQNAVPQYAPPPANYDRYAQDSMYERQYY